jgi:hypothetical protein
MSARDSLAGATLAAVQRFNDAFNRHDVDAVMALMTADCVFHSTRPPPDGERIEGQARVRGFWEEFFRRSPQARFETERSSPSPTAVSSGGFTTGCGRRRPATCGAWTCFASATAGWPRSCRA